jgi:hypothetical protein
MQDRAFAQMSCAKMSVLAVERDPRKAPMREKWFYIRRIPALRAMGFILWSLKLT